MMVDWSVYSNPPWVSPIFLNLNPYIMDCAASKNLKMEGLLLKEQAGGTKLLLSRF